MASDTRGSGVGVSEPIFAQLPPRPSRSSCRRWRRRSRSRSRSWSWSRNRNRSSQLLRALNRDRNYVRAASQVLPSSAQGLLQIHQGACCDEILQLFEAQAFHVEALSMAQQKLNFHLAERQGATVGVDCCKHEGFCCTPRLARGSRQSFRRRRDFCERRRVKAAAAAATSASSILLFVLRGGEVCRPSCYSSSSNLLRITIRRTVKFDAFLPVICTVTLLLIVPLHTVISALPLLHSPRCCGSIHLPIIIACCCC